MNQQESRSKLSTANRPTFDSPSFDGQEYVDEIAAILIDWYGAGTTGMKHCARDARASLNTVRNWFEGRNGPHGPHLLRLMALCDPLFEWVLTRAGRAERLDAIERERALAAMAEIVKRVAA